MYPNPSARVSHAVMSVYPNPSARISDSHAVMQSLYPNPSARVSHAVIVFCREKRIKQQCHASEGQHFFLHPVRAIVVCPESFSFSNRNYFWHHSVAERHLTRALL